MKIMTNTLAQTVKIMNYIESNKTVPEADLKSKFGENIYWHFSRYCMGGGTVTYAEDKDGIILTKDGIKELYRLRGILADERRAKSITIATIIIAIGTVGSMFL